MTSIYYHYCSIDAFMKIVIQKKIRLCNVMKLNDEEECIDIDRIIDEVVNENNDWNNDKNVLELIKDYKKHKVVTHKAYIACFSKDKDRLSQWRSYANDGKGVAIGFDFNKLTSRTNDEIRTLSNCSPEIVTMINTSLGHYKVIYSEEDKKQLINSILSSYVSEVNMKEYKDLDSIINKFSRVLLKCTTIFKNQCFNEEEEKRIVYLPYLDENNNIEGKKVVNTINNIINMNKGYYCKEDIIIGYYEYDFNKDSISEIVLGPKCNMSEEDIDLKSFLDAHIVGYSITKSKATYR